MTKISIAYLVRLYIGLLYLFSLRRRPGQNTKCTLKYFNVKAHYGCIYVVFIDIITCLNAARMSVEEDMNGTLILFKYVLF